VTPKGGKPTGAMAREAPHHEAHAAASSRYTPPTPQEFYESPRWVPILMFSLIGLGAVSIMLRYVVPAWNNTNYPVVVGLVLMLGGLFTATKWH
jgi:hypothetical protein